MTRSDFLFKMHDTIAMIEKSSLIKKEKDTAINNVAEMHDILDNLWIAMLDIDKFRTKVIEALAKSGNRDKSVEIALNFSRNRVAKAFGEEEFFGE